MKKILSLASFLLVGASSLWAGIVLDQNQPSGSVFMAGFSQGDLAQSFIQSNGNVAGAGILLQSSVGTSGNVTISLWDALPSNSGNLLASGSAVGFAGSWLDVYWTPVAINTSSTYFLVFSGNTTLGIAGDLDNPYLDGQVYANSGFLAYPSYDYTFRTYAEVSTNTPSVPDSTSVASLLGLGLVGLAVLRRRWMR